ncbi:MAG: hypothetical protein D6681_10585 [Calditrichaeota bacterium]|nr:MAG: hypothetical protein D6681_10585 [Calditrichota bacterium]
MTFVFSSWLSSFDRLRMTARNVGLSLSKTDIYPQIQMSCYNRLKVVLFQSLDDGLLDAIHKARDSSGCRLDGTPANGINASEAAALSIKPALPRRQPSE